MVIQSLRGLSIIALLVAAQSVAVVLEARNGAAHGDATWYHTGQGACGAWSKDSDHVVALSPRQYAGGDNCWRHIKIHYQGKTVDATAVDLCPECQGDSIDLSPSAFSSLAGLDVGRIQVTWSY
ncbi:hypothetical protein HGRIS_000899 [Hohenbuehelia grisea]|uniref:RlpA-like protein double-psi beta-barrel domain-containing protein n=1 Tax=Hohenbuehelia grisea TaxID=104357 RepID=A0ABR3IQ36_9AGAR